MSPKAFHYHDFHHSNISQEIIYLWIFGIIYFYLQSMSDTNKNYLFYISSIHHYNQYIQNHTASENHSTSSINQ